MSRFVQLHILTHYPPSNLNRDDTGRPKTAVMGGVNRLRVSSQSLKRAWRTSEAFETALAGHVGIRTKRLGEQYVYPELIKAGVADKAARDWTRKIAAVFGKLKSDKKTDNNEDLEIEQLVHLSPEEVAAIQALTQVLATRKTEPTDQELKLLSESRAAVDIAMFGRMLASSPDHNVEAAVQVAHAITVHQTIVDDDFFTAVDDLKKDSDSGSSHLGERGFGAGLFYLYLCIDRESLQKNLGNDAALTQKALSALVKAVTTVSPTGMQNSFASRAYAAYVLAEKGNQQPRSLSQAFLKPIRAHEDTGMLDEAVTALDQRFQNFNSVYGDCSDAQYVVNVEKPEGSLAELIQFVAE